MVVVEVCVAVVEGSCVCSRRWCGCRRGGVVVVEGGVAVV